MEQLNTPQNTLENSKSNETIINNQEFDQTRNKNSEIPEYKRITQESNPNPDLEKIKIPKRKYCIIHGYNGHGFSGNQKNPDVRTVEGDLEQKLFESKYISECNFGALQKINWMRASRTDKKVSAIMNCISVKLHKYSDNNEAEIKEKLNDILPKDIKIFRVIEVSNNFCSKDSNNNRDYKYITPSFLFRPKIDEDKANPETCSSKVGIDAYQSDHSYKITPEVFEKIEQICKFFKGTRKYHNYTRKLPYTDNSANRHIYHVTPKIVEFKDSKTGQMMQGISFTLVGQSFLYNQIRKMIGCIVDLCRNGKDLCYLENTFLGNKVDVPKAPAEGLFLFRIDYGKYNERKKFKKNNIFLSEQDEQEMEDFRLELEENIGKSEFDDKVFSKWLWKLDNNPEFVY